MLLDCRAPDSEIQSHALWSAGRVRTYLSTLGRSTVWDDIWPATADGIINDLNNLAIEHGAKPIPKKTTLEGRAARMVDPKWWRRNLRTQTLRENENEEHAAGQIRRKHQVYVTEHASKAKRERAEANRRTLENLEVVNQDGQAFNLQEIADKSVSNPKLRRAELMTRCRGFEEAAQFMGHTGYFLTFTCPSRFHRVNYAGVTNSKWNGATTKDGQNYLCKVWAKIRAAWKKRGFSPYGFRVAEPHHDGCPHWHILLFFPSEQARVLLSIASRYALQDCPTEAGAKKRRFTVKRIDPSKGSATGYIAKYICKNIDGTKEDGEQMGMDFDSGSEAGIAAKRVKDWAGVHGIRQFQQIGGPSVTVWRELRRLGEDAETLQLEMFEKPRAAASRGDWFSFWMVQGGPEVARADLALRPFYDDTNTGIYGEQVQVIKGVCGFDDTGLEQLEITRLNEWTVQCAGLSAVNDWQADLNEARFFKASNATFLQAYEDAEFKRIGKAERTRTGINNCSDGEKDPSEKGAGSEFDFSKFEQSDPSETEHLYQKGDSCDDPLTMFQDIWAAEAVLRREGHKLFSASPPKLLRDPRTFYGEHRQ